MRERERQKANSVQAPFISQWTGTASLPVTNICAGRHLLFPKARLDRPYINGIGASIINGQQGNPFNNRTSPLPHLPLLLLQVKISIWSLSVSTYTVAGAWCTREPIGLVGQHGRANTPLPQLSPTMQMKCRCHGELAESWKGDITLEKSLIQCSKCKEHELMT